MIFEYVIILQKQLKGALQKAPFVFLTASIILGICLQKSLQINLNNTHTCILILAFGIAFVIFSKFYKNFRLLFLHFWFVVFGMLYPSFFLQKFPPITGFYSGEIKIVSGAKEHVKTYSYTGITNNKSKVKIYLQKDSKPRLNYGDIINCKTRFNEIKNQENSTFDYKAYLANQHIHAQAYVDSSSWEHTNSFKDATYFALQTRQKAINKLSQSGVNEDALAIIAALCFGDKELLENETEQQFIAAGAMHVLAVSGLHVGIISSILILAFSFLPKNSHTTILKTTLIIGGIWIYAFITGLSPSVLRAAIMFSLFSLSLLIKRKTSSFNTLATSVFIAILINPYTIFLVGFQLSHIAVLGIISGIPLVRNFTSSKNVILNYIIGILTVSTVVNIALLPISANTFNSFATYGIPFSVVVIPLAFLILATTILAFLPFIKMGVILNYIVEFFLGSIEFVSQLKNATVHISFSTKTMYISYAIILIITILLYTKRQYNKEHFRDLKI